MFSGKARPLGRFRIGSITGRRLVYTSAYAKYPESMVTIVYWVPSFGARHDVYIVMWMYECDAIHHRIPMRPISFVLPHVASS